MKYTLSPTRTSIISCNTAISKKNYLFCRNHKDLVGNSNVDGESLYKCSYVWIEWCWLSCAVYVCENKISQVLCQGWFGTLSASTSKVCKLLPFGANFLSCEKIMLWLRNLVLIPQKVSLTGIIRYSIPVALSK